MAYRAPIDNCWLSDLLSPILFLNGITAIDPTVGNQSMIKMVGVFFILPGKAYQTLQAKAQRQQGDEVFYFTEPKLFESD